MQQKSVRFGFDGVGDLRTQPQQPFEAKECIDTHPQIDHHQVGIRGKIDSAAVYLCHTGNFTPRRGRDLRTHQIFHLSEQQDQRGAERD